MHYDYFTVLPDTHTNCILLTPKDGVWTLPQVSRSQRTFWQDVGHINDAMLRQWGVRVTTLRCLDTEYRANEDRVIGVYVLENHDPTWAPSSDAVWTHLDDLDSIPLLCPDHALLLARWRKGMDAPTDNEVAWYQPGWFDEAVAWIQKVLFRLSIEMTGPVRQLRTWQRSSILSVETDSGRIYLKATPPMFSHEPVLTHALFGRYPNHFPKVIARHPHRHWYLMRDAGNISLDQSEDIFVWTEAMRTFSIIQLDLVERQEQLLAFGCPDRRLFRLADQIDDLLQDVGCMMPGHAAGMKFEDIALLKTLGPLLRQMCERLAEYNIPDTLEHGDFHPGQVLLAGETPIFLDWSDSSIAHPFFSFESFADIGEMEGRLLDEPEWVERLLLAYLGPWTAYEAMPRLLEAFELARPLAAVHQALMYRNAILPNMQQKWEMHYMVPFFLKKLLRYLTAHEEL